jgi:cyclopropane fatty-acyl-phospholipid synthase-like methyltransferase
LPSDGLIASVYAKSKTYHRKSDPRERYAMISRINRIEKFTPKGKLLDIGCGTGLLLDVAVERGWDVFGLEPAQEGIETISTSVKSRVMQGVLTKGLFETESFDVVVFWSVIEHVINPVELLTIAHDLLKTGGILVIQTPNVDSLSARLFRGQWTSTSFIDHLILWSRESLLKVISNLGFKVIKLQYAGTPFPFGYNFRKQEIQTSGEMSESRKKQKQNQESKQRLLDYFRHMMLRSKACHFLIKNLTNVLHLGDNIEVYAKKT